MTIANSRRRFLSLGALGPALLLNACSRRDSTPSTAPNTGTDIAGKKEEPETEGARDVTATEDLMREHGVLRRALLVYSETVPRLRTSPGSIPPGALEKTARLFRAFGEDYHERKLEETYIFPAIKRAGGAVAAYPDILIAQHNRGREVTDFILSVSRMPGFGGHSAALATALESLVRMYRHHAAWEDTIIFPAWKETVTDDQYRELNDKFEEIEHQQFGADGFEDAVRQIGEIESDLGLADLSQFTAPPPPAMR